MLLVPVVGWSGKVLPTVALAWHGVWNGSASQQSYANAVASGLARKVVIGFHSYSDTLGTHRTPSSILAAGQTATSRYSLSFGNNSRIGFATASIPANASGNLVINWNGNVTSGGAAIWNITGELVSEVPLTTQSSTGDPQACTMNIAGFGIGFSKAGFASGAPSCAWSGLVEDYEEVLVTVSKISGAHLNGTFSNLSVSADWTQSETPERGGIFCTWA